MAAKNDQTVQDQSAQEGPNIGGSGRRRCGRSGVSGAGNRGTSEQGDLVKHLTPIKLSSNFVILDSR